MMEKNLYLLLGDVKSSRKIENRDYFQDKLIKSYNKLNEDYIEDFYAKFKIIKGLDEIGCVLTNPVHIYDMIIEILDQIHPQEMRFAIVYDTINTGLEGEKKDITKMDGPAFHRASELMNDLKNSKLYFDMSINIEEILDSNNTLYNKELSHTINEIIKKELVKLINQTISKRQKWTEKQRNIIKEYDKFRNQKEVANKQNITQQAVSKQLKTADLKEIRNTEESVKEILDLYSKLLSSDKNV
jgi:hypothetical protein